MSSSFFVVACESGKVWSSYLAVIVPHSATRSLWPDDSSIAVKNSTLKDSSCLVSLSYSQANACNIRARPNINIKVVYCFWIQVHVRINNSYSTCFLLQDNCLQAIESYQYSMPTNVAVPKSRKMYTASLMSGFIWQVLLNF